MKELNDLQAYFDLSPSQMADSWLHCPVCGRDHEIPFRFVNVGRSILDLIPNIIKSTLEREHVKIGMVFDRQIEDKLSSLFIEPISRLGLNLIHIPLGEKGLLLEPSVEIGDKAAGGLSEDVQFLIGVGSGVISDLTKWIGTKRGLPFMLVGTAASMNAYTSITGTMTENNIKLSKWLDPAQAVLLDSNLLASAPQEMTCAGVGDLLARNVANADWKLSQLIRGTYFCQVPFQMMSSFQESFLHQIHLLGKNEPDAMQALGEGILVSGYSMTVLNGETSPSSGSEHVLSHFFDFQHEIYNLPKNLHGTQVGIATIIMSTAFEMLREMSPSEFDIDKITRSRVSQSTIRQDHQRIFGEYSKNFDQVVAGKWIEDASYRDYIRKIIGNWDAIWDALNPYLMSAAKIRQAMKDAGAVTQLSGIHRTIQDALQGLLYGSHYRSRYTILDLLWELGLFPSIAGGILERACVLD